MNIKNTRKKSVPENDKKLLQSLPEREQELYFKDGFTAKQRARLLQMNHEDRAKVCATDTDEQVKAQMWAYASTRALKTINNGMVRDARSKHIAHVGKWLVCIGLFVLVPLDFIINGPLRLYELHHPNFTVSTAPQQQETK